MVLSLSFPPSLKSFSNTKRRTLETRELKYFGSWELSLLLSSFNFFDKSIQSLPRNSFRDKDPFLVMKNSS